MVEKTKQKKELWVLWEYYDQNAGNVFKNVQILKDELQEVQPDMMLDSELQKQEISTCKELDETLIIEKLFWAQTSRTRWLNEGDRNTSFFFNQFKDHQNSSKIFAINENNGDTVTGHDRSISSKKSLKWSLIIMILSY